MKRPPEAPAIIRNSQPNSAYDKVEEVEETGEAALFAENNYKISVSKGLRLSHMRPLICVIDTGAGPGIISGVILVPDWRD